jgi:hypothetical protein
MTQQEYVSLKTALRTVESTTREYRQLRPPAVERPGKMSEQARFADYDDVVRAATELVQLGEKLSIESITRRLFRRDPGRVREVVGHLRREDRFPWALEVEVKSS